MAQNAQNVVLAKPSEEGALFWAPLGTAIDPDPAVALPAACKSAGYISSDGITRSSNVTEGTEIIAFGGDPVKTSAPTFNPNITFTIWEMLNKDALALAYPEADITVTGSDFTIKDSLNLPVDKVLVLELLLNGGTHVQRVVMPHASFSTRGDEVYNNEDVAGLEITYNLRKDSTLGAVSVSMVSETVDGE